MNVKHAHFSTVWCFAVLFVVSVPLNYVWEFAQSFLYAGLGPWQTMLWHCFIASLGDGILVWIIYVTGLCIFRRLDWFMSSNPGTARYSVMLITGSVIGIGVEWVAVHVMHRWSYTAAMPIVPYLNIGMVPFAQMLLLPPLIFHVVAELGTRAKNKCAGSATG
jgi:hypothetical protein